MASNVSRSGTNTGVEGSAALVMAPRRPKDILIAVMGITGSGKSTFISHCTKAVVPIGNNLQSHTQELTAYRYKFAPEENVYLIDTPGFDDTNREDIDVLRDIADWVTKVYEKRIDLRGVIYLHRITDTRMQGSAKKNLYMFKKLCGTEGLKNVILATTMWENVAEEVGQKREAELRDTPDYWKDMIEQHGSRMVRHHNNSDSARQIIDSLLQSAQPTTYAIQNEMVNQGKDLDQTSAGMELSSIQDADRERFERQLQGFRRDMDEARELQDRELQEQIRRLQEEKRTEIAKLQTQKDKMEISLERLHREKNEELREMIERMRSDAESSRAGQGEQRQIIEQLRQTLATYSLIREASPDSLDVNPDNSNQHRVRSPQSALVSSPRRQPSQIMNLDERSAQRFSLALCGPYYSFCGPASNFLRLSQTLQETFDENPGTEYQVFIGPNDSMIRVSADENGDFREDYLSLETTHPPLHDYMSEWREEFPEFVSLGPHGWYFFECNDGCRVEGPSDLMALNHMKKVWFGYNDSWIAETDEYFRWDLKGYYGELEEVLRGYYSGGSDRIMEIALNIENGTDYIVLFTRGASTHTITIRDTRTALLGWLNENGF